MNQKVLTTKSLSNIAVCKNAEEDLYDILTQNGEDEDYLDYVSSEIIRDLQAGNAPKYQNNRK